MFEALPFHVVGVSHHNAALGVRERLVLPAAELTAVLAQERGAGHSALVLSTCNRSELYWSGPAEDGDWFVAWAGREGDGAPTGLTRLEGGAAVRHLFQVSAGLESQILGETEILGQVRRAYDQARAAGTTTRVIDMIFSSALTCGRRIRSETLLGRHPSSVSAAAVALAADRLGGLAQRDVVVLGAGEAAEGVLRALDSASPRRVTLVNRHAERGKVLASAWGAETGEWHEVDARMAGSDLVIVATGASRAVVSAAQLERAIAARDGQELTVMDLSVPRNVDTDARMLAGIRLFDLDDLQRLCCPAAGIPSAALSEARRVLEDELVRLDLALRSRAAAPRLAELHRLGAEVAAEETAWALSQLEALGDRERDVVRRMAERLVRRVLYSVSKAVRSEE